MLAPKITVVVVLLMIMAIAIAGTVKLTHKYPKLPSQVAVAHDPKVVRYLPLGDSYTIGQSVAESGRWPNQLTAQYRPDGKQLQIVANPSVTGYTTQDLIDRELPLVKQLQPDFVTVLIGVNDYVQGVDSQTFEQHLRFIVVQLQKQLAQPGNVLLVTIPDYAKTPTGAGFGDPVAATAAIAHFNQIITQVAASAQLPVADIFGVSQQAASDPSLVAPDGLHPSAKQYQAWTAIIQKSLQTAGILH